MKRTIVSMICIAFVLAIAPTAIAQLLVGSPEDKLYQQILDEKTADKKAQLLLNFEKNFPQSKVLPDVYVNLMGIYQRQGEQAKTIDFGEKAIKLDSENVSALMAVAREYAIQRKNLDRALQYAQKAVNSAVKMKAQPAPESFAPEQWKQYVENTEDAARSILLYVKSIRP
jgi:tetratricopeptide (TPR) repeat protein